MFWLIAAVLVVIAGAVLLRQRKGYAVEREPWEADPEDDAPLDIDEIRRAEQEFDAETEADWDGLTEEEWR